MNVAVASAATAFISAVKYGPLAWQKFCAMAGVQPGGGVTWPAGKGVKIVFHEQDQEGAKETFMWKPGREYLHDVFVKAGMSIADFHLAYEQDGEVLQLDATKLGIEDFLTDHSQHPDPRLKADGAMELPLSCGRRFVEHKGYRVEHWDEAVKSLQQLLELTDAETAPLKVANLRDDGKAVHFMQQKHTGKRITTTYAAYHTVMHGDKIDVIYGKHEESMEVSGEAIPLPSQNCIQYDGRIFSVDVTEGRRLRFEVIDRTGAPATRLVLDSPVAFAEIEAKDLARKKRWRLLLSDPATSEAVYGSPPRNARWTRSDAEAPPTVRKPSFLLLRTEADTALSKGRLSAATTMLPEDRSTAMVSLASSVASKPPLEENLSMPMLERPSRPEPSRQEDTRSSLGSLVTNSSRPKVMLMTRGTRGDVQPFVALARGLILYHNCDVVLVTELLWKNFVKSAAEELPLPYQGRLRFRPCGGDTSRRVSGDMARFVLSLGQDSLALQALVFSRSEVEFFSSEGCFFHWAWEERPTFIVFGFLMIHVAMIISEALQIPIVGFILQPLREIEPTMERTALDELFGPLRRVFAGQKFNAVLQQVMESLPDRYTLRDLRLSRGLAPCPSNILASNQQAEELRHHNVPLIVPVSPVALGEQVATLAEKGMRLTDFIFLRQGSCQLDAEVSDFIARAKQDRRKVVAMTFSSMPVGERRMLEIAAAICRRCHTPEEGRKPVVIALVSGQPPEETTIPDIQRLEEKQRLLVLRRPVDFGALFPKVDAAILHGGLGVTSEALLAGIPVVTSGILLMDQRYWAARIHELGSGCEPESTTPPPLSQAAQDASPVPAGPMAPVTAASTEDEDVSFQVSLMNGAHATITCKAADKLQSLHGRISEALEGVGCRSPLCYFRSTQENPQLLAGHTEAAEVAGAEIRVVVQAEPIWCSEKCFRRAASFNELPGYLDDQWEEERLRFFTCGVFELHKHFHSNHGSMPAEDCLEKENYLVATGEWELDGEDVLLIGMQKICGRSSGQTA
eukprot:s1407_g9.t2